MKCPKCGSAKVINVRKEIYNNRGTLVRVPPQYRCIKCNHKWRIDGD